jgi:hypothetical protein
LTLELARISLKRLIAASAIAMALGGCVSTPDPIVEDRSRCDGYGFARGTDAYANCVMTADRDRQRRLERRMERAPYGAPEE